MVAAESTVAVNIDAKGFVCRTSDNKPMDFSDFAGKYKDEVLKTQEVKFCLDEIPEINVNVLPQGH